MPPESASQSPSQRDATGMTDVARESTIILALQGNLSVRTLPVQHRFRRPGRIIDVEVFKRTAGAGVGAGGTTTTDVKINGTTILTAAMALTQASGDAQRAYGNLDLANKGTSEGITVAAGDLLTANITAFDDGATVPTDLTVEVTFRVG